jgi:hypothetical protein
LHGWSDVRAIPDVCQLNDIPIACELCLLFLFTSPAIPAVHIPDGELYLLFLLFTSLM